MRFLFLRYKRILLTDLFTLNFSIERGLADEISWHKNKFRWKLMSIGIGS